MSREQFTLRLPKEVIEALDRAAASEGRSRTKYIEALVRRETGLPFPASPRTKEERGRKRQKGV